jgi:hypothetical protein
MFRPYPWWKRYLYIARLMIYLLNTICGRSITTFKQRKASLSWLMKLIKDIESLPWVTSINIYWLILIHFYLFFRERLSLWWLYTRAEHRRFGWSETPVHLRILLICMRYDDILRLPYYTINNGIRSNPRCNYVFGNFLAFSEFSMGYSLGVW